MIAHGCMLLTRHQDVRVVSLHGWHSRFTRLLLQGSRNAGCTNEIAAARQCEAASSARTKLQQVQLYGCQQLASISGCIMPQPTMGRLLVACRLKAHCTGLCCRACVNSHMAIHPGGTESTSWVQSQLGLVAFFMTDIQIACLQENISAFDVGLPEEAFNEINEINKRFRDPAVR